jgi:hypothetical protein
VGRQAMGPSVVRGGGKGWIGCPRTGPFWKITLSTASEGLKGDRAGFGRDAPGREHDRRLRSVGDGGGGEQEERGMAKGGEAERRDAAGRRSGRDSQPRFADAKVKQTQTAISRETTID